jgi:transcriptional regulator with XRE-family HTH domain
VAPPAQLDLHRRMTLTSRIGENLKWLRERTRLFHGELADLIGTHRTEVSLFERGGREPRLEMLVKLAGSREIDIDELSADIAWKPAGQCKKQPDGRFEITPPPPDLED